MSEKKKKTGKKEKAPTPEKPTGPTPGRCAICERFIYYEFKEESYDDESALKDSGRAEIHFGYGSEFDLRQYRFLLCDPCFRKIKKRSTHYRYYNKGMDWIKIPRKKHDLPE